MDARADELLAALRNSNLSIESKAATLSKLKSEIKQKNVPQEAIPTTFEAFRLAISSQQSSLSTGGFSALGHLLKRLYLQEEHPSIAYHGRHLYPLLLERLGDHKERIRSQASQAFTDFWTAAPADVEHQVLDLALAGKNGRAKETSLVWLLKMSKEHNLLFRTYVPRLVTCLEDADSGVRETAKSTVVELFQNVPPKALSDLKKQLQLQSVRKSIVSSIMTNLGAGGLDPDLSMNRSQSRSDLSRPGSSLSSRKEDVQRPASVLSSRSHSNGDGSNMSRIDASFQGHAQSAKSEQPRKERGVTNSAGSDTHPANSADGPDSDAIEPLYVNTQRELDEIFREMAPHFEGKESEHNWSPREKSVLKLRKLTKGNAPHDFQNHYIPGIKSLLDGILKTVHSLRTTVSSVGCNLLQDIARTCGPAIDHMVEILLQQLIKLCGSLKKITAQNGNTTVETIISHVTYNTRIMQHIWGACQEKNVQPRFYATGWIKTVIACNAKNKSAVEHSGGLDLLEKCIKKGLGDANPDVREKMRGTYWAFAGTWPERAEAIMSTLDPKSKNLLEKDSGNPNRSQQAQKATTPRSKSRPTTPARSTLKDTISAQKKARLAASKNVPPRPESSQSTFNDTKSTSTTRTASQRQPSSTTSSVRTVPTGTSLSASQGASLSSAPMRPSGRSRRPELARPATADPYSSRRSVHSVDSQSKPSSPVARPQKPRTKSVVMHGTKSATPVRPKSRANEDPRSVSKTKSMKPENSPELRNTTGTPVSPEATKPPATPTAPGNVEVSVPHATNIEDTEMRSPHIGMDQHSIEEPGREHHDPHPVAALSEFPGGFPTTSPRSRRGTNDGSISRIPISPSSRSRKSGDDVAISMVSPRKSHSRDVSDDTTSRIPTPAKRSSLANEPQSLATLQVYEDPQSPPETKESSRPAEPPQSSPKTPRTATKATPLEELPLNEPATVPNRKHNQLQEANTVTPSSENSHRRWKKVESSERKRSLSPRSKDPVRARDMIDRGLNKIRAGGLDVHGYRKFQSLLRYHEAIVNEQARYDQILTALLEAIQAPSGEKPLGRSTDLKTQVLVTLRILLAINGQLFATYHAKVMTAILSARKHYDSTNHIVSGLEETSEDIVAACDPPEVIDAVLDSLEAEERTPEGYRMVAMGTYILSGLLRRLNEKKLFLGESELRRLGDFARQNLRNPQPDVRRAVIDFCLELHEMVTPEDVFWSMVDSPTGDVRPLLTYYIMKKPTQAQSTQAQ